VPQILAPVPQILAPVPNRLVAYHTGFAPDFPRNLSNALTVD
jgi:hypothetical protein